MNFFDEPDPSGVGPFPFPFGHIIGTIVTGLGALLCLLVLVGLIFLLVRFLLVATKAAQLYVAKNAPTGPVEPTRTATAVSTAPVAPAAAAAAKPAAAKPPAKPPAPKA